MNKGLKIAIGFATIGVVGVLDVAVSKYLESDSSTSIGNARGTRCTCQKKITGACGITTANNDVIRITIKEGWSPHAVDTHPLGTAISTKPHYIFIMAIGYISCILLVS